MHVQKGARAGRVDFYQRVVRRFHIGEEQVGIQAGQRGGKGDAIGQMLLIVALHRRAAPTEMPDGAVERGAGRLLDLVEEQIHLFTLHALPTGERCLLCDLKRFCIKLNGCRGIDRIQMDVMKQRCRRRLRDIIDDRALRGARLMRGGGEYQYGSKGGKSDFDSIRFREWLLVLMGDDYQSWLRPKPNSS